MATMYDHPKYTFPDGKLIVEGKRCRFRIHHYLLENTALAGLKGYTNSPDIPDIESCYYVHLNGVTDEAFVAFLNFLYLTDDPNAGRLGQDTLISALDVSEAYSIKKLSARIATQLRSVPKHTRLNSAFVMLACCLRHRKLFPRPFVVEQYTYICTTTEEITSVHLKIVDRRMIVNIMEGREVARKTSNRCHLTTSRYSPDMEEWAAVTNKLATIRPSHQAAGEPSQGSSFGALCQKIEKHLARCSPIQRLARYWLALFGDRVQKTNNSLPVHSIKYFFEDGTVVLRVEDVLYNIHQYKIRGAVFDPELMPPNHESNETIPLPGLRAKDFDVLLEYLYSRTPAERNAFPVPKLMVALGVADRYGMESTCTQIASKLQAIDHSQTLQATFSMLACCLRHQPYFQRESVIAQFIAICVNPEAVTLKHLEELDIDLIAHIMRGRETAAEGGLSFDIMRNQRRNSFAVPHEFNSIMMDIFPPTGTQGGWKVLEERMACNKH